VPPNQDNLTRTERATLRNVKNNSQLTILPADKGNATVILNTTDYKQKILSWRTQHTGDSPKIQPNQQNVEWPIAYASRQMNKAEQAYTASEAELLALVRATKYFRCFLYGKQFLVRTDHAALSYLQTFADTNSRLMRWSLRLSEFDFTVEHRPGIKIKHVAALSRHVAAIMQDSLPSKEEILA